MSSPNKQPLVQLIAPLTAAAFFVTMYLEHRRRKTAPPATLGKKRWLDAEICSIVDNPKKLNSNGVANGHSASAAVAVDNHIVDQLTPLTEEEKEELAATARALATRGKGILAADESTRTVRTKKLSAVPTALYLQGSVTVSFEHARNKYSFYQRYHDYGTRFTW